MAKKTKIKAVYGFVVTKDVGDLVQVYADVFTTRRAIHKEMRDEANEIANVYNDHLYDFDKPYSIVEDKSQTDLVISVVNKDHTVVEEITEMKYFIKE